MDRPSPIRRLPWGVLLTAVLLAVIGVLVHQPRIAAQRWLVVSAGTVAGVGLFAATRRLVGGLWGLILALTLVLHPLYTRHDVPVHALTAEALKLTTLAGLVASWRCLFATGVRWGRLLAVVVLLCVAGGLAWLTAPLQDGSPAGLVTTVLDAVGLLLAAVLLWCRRGPGIASIVAVALAVLVPAAALVLAWPLSEGIDRLAALGVAGLDAGFPAQVSGTAMLPDVLQNTFAPHEGAEGLVGFAAADRDLWGWPFFWVVLPLMLFGLARSAWRGRAQWSRGQAATAWLLTLFALAVLTSVLLYPSYTRSDLHFLPLATLAVLLSLFAVGDWVSGVGERIRLAPPEEQDTPAAD